MPDGPGPVFDPSDLFGDDAKAGEAFTKNIEALFAAASPDEEGRRRALLEKYKAAKEASRRAQSAPKPPSPPVGPPPLPPLRPLGPPAGPPPLPSLKPLPPPGPGKGMGPNH